MTAVWPRRVRNQWLQLRPVRSVVDVPGVGQISCDTADMIQRFLYQFRVWEPALTSVVRDHLHPGDVVVDVGANIGYYSLLAAALVGPTGHVISFEPSPSVGGQLGANLARNPHGQVVDVVAAAAGPSAGTAQVFRASAANLGQTATRPSPGSVLEADVDVRAIDDCVPPEERERVRLLKVDVEGDELDALRGAVEVLTAMPTGALVLVEVDAPRMRERDASPAEVLDLLAGLGFRPYVIDNSYSVAAYVNRPDAPRRRPDARAPTALLRPLLGPISTGDLVLVKT